MVKIKIPQPLRRCTGGNQEVGYEGLTVSEVLGKLEQEYPEIKERIKDEQGNIRRFVNVFVNGQDIRLNQGADTRLEDGDEISILPAIAGG